MTDYSTSASAQDQAAVTRAGVAGFIIFTIGLIGWGLYKHHSLATTEPTPRALANMDVEESGE